MHCCQARSSGIAALRRNCSMSISKQVLHVVHFTNGLAAESGRTGMKNSVNQSRPCMGMMLVSWRQEGQTVLTGASGRWRVSLRQPKKMMNPRRDLRFLGISIYPLALEQHGHPSTAAHAIQNVRTITLAASCQWHK